jgi:CheY-like chemotaxis protein
VGDEPEIRSTLAAFFSGDGYEVETSSDITDALKKLTRGVDVVVCDIRLPGGSGIEFLWKTHLQSLVNSLARSQPHKNIRLGCFIPKQ